LGPILIGILEDDADQSALLEVWLQDAGFETRVYATGPEFLRAIQQQGFDLMLLDWNLPEMSGLEVLQWVRHNVREPVPVLFLTTREEEEHIVAALEAGADDYVCKPARPQELVARIRSLARRSGLVEPERVTISIDDYVLDRNNVSISIGGEEVTLTHREFELAWMMFDNIDKILSREFLLRNIWNVGSAVKSRTVDTHISRVRSKLNLRPENGWRLSSVYHYGYRLEQVAP
jgi:two-component system response regulator RegX3